MTKEKSPAARSGNPLEPIAILAVGPSEAVDIVRAFIATVTPEAYHSIFEALRSAMWKLMASRTDGDEMGEWYDTMRQCAALVLPSGADSSPVHDKIRVLADLALESNRFHGVHGGDIMQRPYALDILNAIRRNGGTASLEQITAETGVPKNSLIRMLWPLAARGFVRRKDYGKAWASP